MLQVSSPTLLIHHRFAPLFLLLSCRCVYDMHLAVERGVSVELYPHMDPVSFENGWTHGVVCVREAGTRINSERTHCGNPENEPNANKILTLHRVDSTELMEMLRGFV